MENENLDLDVKPAGNKDLWLFLIIIDVVLLCVFGFFIYTHFAADLFQTKTAPTLVEEITDPIEQPAAEVTSPEVAPAEEALPSMVVVQSEEISVAQVLAQQAKEEEKAAAQKAEEEATLAKEVAKEESAKESIIIDKNPKSKYRQVTFRWYGEGEKVAIVSGFTNRKPQALTKKGEYWEITLSIAPGTYKFLYMVDGKNRRDPYAKEQDGRSVVVIE